MCLSLSGCQTINSAFEELSKLPNPLSYISEGAKTSAENAVNKAVPPKKIKSQFESAKTYIIGLTTTTACTDTRNLSRLNKFAAPNEYVGSRWSVYWSVTQHKSGCFHIARITEIKSEGSGQFTFSAYYVSPYTDESAQKSYRALRQSNGEWLFKLL